MTDSQHITRPWRIRPVFISSTFKDFGEERDQLRNFVFPEIEERLRERFHHLEPIDLRWGVETKSVDQEEEKHLLILKVCFGEIFRSRPFLIALIGDRYGWIPPLERVKTAAMEVGYDGEVQNKSITALEMEYGVLNTPEQMTRSRFYFRMPLPYDSMPQDVAQYYSDAYSKEENAQLKVENQSKLKSRIQSKEESPSLVGRWHTYKADWDSQLHKVIGLEAFGKMVLDDLWEDIQAETESYVQKPALTWIEEETRSLAEFVEGRVRDFKGREGTLAYILRFALSPDGEQKYNGLCITGNPGSGKSAVFAKLHRELAKSDVFLLANAAGAGARSTDIDAILERWILELCVFLNLKSPAFLTEGKSEAVNLDLDRPKFNRSKELEVSFRHLLGLAGKTHRVVVLLDALDQMEHTLRGRNLSWMPSQWPENVKVIATGIPGHETSAFLRSKDVEQFDLPLLPPETAKQIIDSICNKYHRSLNPDIAEIILLKENGNIPAHANPLWLSMAIEELNLIDSEDFAYAERMFTGDGESKLFQLMSYLANQMPANVDELYSWIFKRLEDIFGAEVIKACLSLLSLGRKGWGDRLLENIVPILSGKKWDQLNWVAARRLLRAHLVYSVAGNWRFFHQQMTRSVAQLYLPSEEEKLHLHQLLSDYLLCLPPGNPLRSEIMYHLIQGNDMRSATTYYAKDISPMEVYAAAETLANYILEQNELKDTSQKIAFVLSMLTLGGHENATIKRLFDRFQFDVYTLIEHKIRSADRAFYWQKLLAFVEEYIKIQPHDQLWLKYWIGCFDKIGDVNMMSDSIITAIANYLQAMQLNEKLIALHGDTFDRDLALYIIKSKLGDAYVQKGNLEDAVELYKGSLLIMDVLHRGDRGSMYLQRCMAVIISKIGKVQLELGNLTAALRELNASVNWFRHLIKESPESIRFQDELSLTLGYLGNAYLASGKYEEARDAYEEKLEAIQNLQKEDLDNTRWKFFRSGIYIEIGNVFKAQWSLPDALTNYQTAALLLEELVKFDISNRRWNHDLSVAYNMIGDTYWYMNKSSDALVWYEKSLDIRQKLSLVDPQNKTFMHSIAATYDRIGESYMQLQNADSAYTAFKKSLEIESILIEGDPHNTTWKRDLSIAYTKIAYIHQVSRKYEEALDQYQQSLHIIEELTNLDKLNITWQHDLFSTKFRMAEVYKSTNLIDTAFIFFNESHDIILRLTQINPQHLGWMKDLSLTYESLAIILAQTERFAESYDHFLACLKIRENLHALQPDNITFGNDLIQCFEYLSILMKRQGNEAGAAQYHAQALAVKVKLGT